MKKIIYFAAFALAIVIAGSSFAQMMGNGQGMMGNQGSQSQQRMMERNQPQQSNPQTQQTNPYQSYPGMMGGYGYGYGMPQGMMGGYGYGIPMSMMGGYGYGMPMGMMGYGMRPGMMHGYGYPGMMGGYGYGYQEDFKKYQEKQEKFLEETKDLRRKLHTLKFDYSEEARNPERNREKLQEMEEEMYGLHEKIRKKSFN